jgi:hypothetical protein
MEPMIGDTSPVFSPIALGKIAYEAYVKEYKAYVEEKEYEAYVEAGGVSPASGESLPAWSCLSLEIRKPWEAAGNAVFQTVFWSYRSTGM